MRVVLEVIDKGWKDDGKEARWEEEENGEGEQVAIVGFALFLTLEEML